MKKQLTALLLICCFIGKGQVKQPDSIPLPKGIITDNAYPVPNVYLDTAALLRDGWKLPEKKLIFVPVEDTGDFSSFMKGWISSDTDYLNHGDILTIRNYNEVVLPDYDTIPCIILYSDTSIDLDTAYYNSLNDGWKRTIRAARNNPFTYWMYAYSVRKKQKGNPPNSDFYCMDCPDYMEHLYYLDADKKPLDGYIVVWMAK